MVNCEHCGKETSKKRFCSRGCMYNTKRKPRKKCPNCGKESPRAETIYCSRKCMGEHKTKLHKDSLVYNNCIICGKETLNEKYCSMKCLGKDESRKKTAIKNLKNERYWTGEEIQYLKENYGRTNINVISKNLQRSNSAVIAFAQKSNIKSDKYWSDDETDFLLRNTEKGIDYISVQLGKSYSSIANKITNEKSKFPNNKSPEDVCKEILDSINLEYRYEVRIGNYLTDFLVGNLDIEVQGTYWHCDPRFYPNGAIDDRQEEGITRDKKKKEFLESVGIDVLYLWEYDLLTNPQECKEILESRTKIAGLSGKAKSKDMLIRTEG